MARQKKPFDAVQFTRESSERIARVVRAAETSLPGGSPLSFEPFVDGRKPRQVRAATFSGSWPIGSSKVVTFKNAPISTATVQNLSWPITLTAYSNEDCVVGRDGTAWYLVVPRLEARTAAFVTQTGSASVVTAITTSTSSINYLASVSVSASLNTNSCAITVGITQVTASTSFVRYVSYVTSSFATISSTATASFLRIRVP